MFRHCAKCLCGLYYLRNKQEGLLMILTPFYRRGNEGLRLAKCQRSTGCCPRTSHNASRWWSWTLSSGLSVWNAQFSSVTQSCLTLCDPIDCSTPDFPVYYQLPEFTQTHVHRVGDAIQSSHPLLSPSPPTFKLSQHQGLFQ